jgi:serine/threonine protein kinase|uniref:Protein kinase domain-containing protein n=1 Tax=Fagus sylvatica TaxID=28930 RepID=A0A2N9J939_FAGSY
MVGKKERERAFLENGSRLLEELIVSCNGRPPPIRSFSIEELRRATNNYDPCRMLHDDGDFKWYSGSFEGRMVYIKKFTREFRQEARDVCFTDIAICSKMSAHNNVLKLVGCCLESPIPISVYESATNGTLATGIRVSSHQQQRQSITWQSRLKIAKDIAHTISYLHVAFSRPIVHRDIQSRHIFLDQNDVAKLADFSLSIEIPEDQDHVEDAVRGTIWFLCPTYLITGCITEKSDTYSFGMFLVELLTGQTLPDLARLAQDEDALLIDYLKHHAANEIVDPALLVGEGGAGMEQQLEAVLRLALICTERDPERRPTMTDVTKELIRIERSIP